MPRLAVIALAAAAFIGFGHARADERCATPPALQAKPAPARVAGKLASDRALRIVALGSSSTAGHAASTPELTYPNQLRRMLNVRSPGAAVEVLNKGVNGQLAADMVRRMDQDVIALNPDLVIWQTGTNDALKGVAPDAFIDQIDRGLAALADAGIDVVLVDPQFFPSIPDAAAFERYVEAMRDGAAKRGVPVLQRYAIMRNWAATADGPRVLAADQFHMNDLGYACLAEMLADLITR